MQVLLDVESIQPDRILLLDSFFYVVVFHGTSIAQWRKEGYHLQEEHEGFRQLLEVPSPLAWQSMHALLITKLSPQKSCLKGQQHLPRGHTSVRWLHSACSWDSLLGLYCLFMKRSAWIAGV